METWRLCLAMSLRLRFVAQNYVQYTCVAKFFLLLGLLDLPCLPDSNLSPDSYLSSHSFRSNVLGVPLAPELTSPCLHSSFLAPFPHLALPSESWCTLLRKSVWNLFPRGKGFGGRLLLISPLSYGQI